MSLLLFCHLLLDNVGTMHPLSTHRGAYLVPGAIPSSMHRVCIFRVVGLVCFLRNELNDSVSKIEHEEKKKNLTAQMMICIIWATLCTKWLVCGHRWCWHCWVLLWESVLMALGSWEERGERGEALLLLMVVVVWRRVMSWQWHSCVICHTHPC